MATARRNVGTVMLVQLTNDLRQVHASLRILKSENVLMSMNVHVRTYVNNASGCIHAV